MNEPETVATSIAEDTTPLAAGLAVLEAAGLTGETLEHYRAWVEACARLGGETAGRWPAAHIAAAARRYVAMAQGAGW